MEIKVIGCLASAVMFLLVSGSALAGEVCLAEGGESRCVIVVPPGSMQWAGDGKELDRWSPNKEEPERRRRLLRDSIRDLAGYLGRMSGAKVEVVESLPADKARIPIFIGLVGQQAFGPVGLSRCGLFAFRVVVGAKGVGLYGESEYGTSYAIYEVLHRLGCRWYMPSELGECIPSSTHLVLQEMDAVLAPFTEWRRMEGRTADADFRRRNRMGGSMDGGNVLDEQHALDGYITREQRAAHPEWRLLVEGKPHPEYLRWTREEVAVAVADNIIAKLDKAYAPTVSLSPGDYVMPTDDPEEMAGDPVPRVWEPAASQWSVTDRMVLLANRVAERVGRKYPDVRFGLLAYVNHSMPPKKQILHPNVIPVIAPIDFNRAHPMTWTNHPNGTWLLDMVQGWSKVSPRIGYYAYGMNLAELSAPNPFITKWGTDIPLVLSNHCAFWMPETMGGWESMMPGFYLSMRLTFDPKEYQGAILSELWARFYGPAAEPMERYWHRMDRAWIDSAEYAGGAFGYLRIFTPEVMRGARADVNEALSRCRTPMEYRRVKLVDDSLTQFELFMKMRHDWAAGRMARLAADLEDWRGAVKYLQGRYRKEFCFGGLTIDYIDSCFGSAYSDGSRVARECVFPVPALLTWKYCFIGEGKGEERGWVRPDFDDSGWKTTHVVEETWSSLGYHNGMGRMAYRTTVSLPAVPAGKKAILWIGSTDGSAELFINGTLVKYMIPRKTRLHAQGDTIGAACGFCEPFEFEVTRALRVGSNQVTIICERNWLNEVGTGGLMGPVVVAWSK